jgi:hypothetical protein
MRAVPGGGTILAGEAFSGVFLLRLDADLEVVWQREISELGDARSVAATASGGFLLLGSSAGGVHVLALDGDGSVQRDTTLANVGFSSASWIEHTTDGGAIVAGATPPAEGAEWDAFLSKLDAAGAVQWQKTFGTPTSDTGDAVQQTADGGYVLAFTTTDAQGNDERITVVKTDGAGVVSWQTAIPGVNARATAVRELADGGFVVAGIRNRSEMYLLRLDAAGVRVWDRGDYVPGRSDRANGAVVAGDEIVVAGHIDTAAGELRPYILGAALADGGVRWMRQLGAEGSAEMQAVIAVTGGYLFAGSTGDGDVCIVPTGPAGEPQ